MGISLLIYRLPEVGNRNSMFEISKEVQAFFFAFKSLYGPQKFFHGLVLILRDGHGVIYLVNDFPGVVKPKIFFLARHAILARLVGLLPADRHPQKPS